MGENSVRVINEDFEKALKDGILKPVTEMVKNSDNLLMCFRGKYINVYYRGHSLFKIEQMLNKKNPYYKVFFNFNHARYTKEWNEVLVQLEAIGYSLNHKSHDVNNKDNIVSACVDKETIQFFWNKSEIILCKLIDDFFSVEEDKSYDYFKRYKVKNKNKFIEKQCQQKILINNNINFKMDKSNWFCLDMEYVMKRENSSEDSFGRFDLIAISKKQRGEKHKIALIELKCGTSAFSDFSDKFEKQFANDNKSFHNGETPVQKIGSGILGHVYDYIRYLNSDKFKTVLKKEVINILNNYNELGLINNFKRIEEDDIDDIPNVYFITLENKDDKCRETMKKYLCKCKGASKYNVEEVLGIDITKRNSVFNPIFLFAEDDGSNIIDIIEDPSYKKGL